MSTSLIAIYGVNNLGKTTQAKLLKERIEKHSNGVKARAEHIKYPIYDLEPTGPMINAYLRKGNPNGLSPREFQILNVLNRLHFERRLGSILHNSGHPGMGLPSKNVVVEDYWGTSLAWGIGAGVDKAFLLQLNEVLTLQEDIAFLLDGSRFSDGVEKGHAHESNDEFTERVRMIHLDLAKEFGWHIINANRSIEEVHEEIWSFVRPLGLI